MHTKRDLAGAALIELAQVVSVVVVSVAVAQTEGVMEGAVAAVAVLGDLAAEWAPLMM
jgi:hypothetical protein